MVCMTSKKPVVESKGTLVETLWEIHYTNYRLIFLHDQITFFSAMNEREGYVQQKRLFGYLVI